MQRRKQNIFRLFLLSGALSVVTCDNLFGMRLTTETLKTRDNTHYRFHYFVKDDETGDYKTQEETKEGDSVRGSYTLAEPNGDLRTVTYKAGPGTGFEAKVDVQPSASPIKHTTEQTTSTLNSDQKIKETTQASVKHFPGGFAMDILKKPQLSGKMGMKFSLNPNVVTESVTTAGTTQQNNTTELKTTPKTETTLEPTTATFVASPTENLQTSTAKTTEDPIQKEIDEVENSMPKLPELVLSDNKTHFKFYKDPEDAFLDERITQIARQLAETSLRREYEERKLGHFIPISVTPVEPITSSHSSKSFKFTKDDVPSFRPSPPSSLQVLSELKLIPQYIYKETILPRFMPVNHRLPVVQTSPPINNEQWDQHVFETVTNVPDILKTNKSESQIKEINEILEEKQSKNYETTERDLFSVVPIQIPTFLQLFSPYAVSTRRNYVTQTKPEPPLDVTPVIENHATTKVPSNTTVNVHSTTVNVTKS